MVFCKSASLMFMPAEVWGLKQSKNSQNISFGLSKLTCIHGKLIKKFFFKYLAWYFSFRESSRHKYICPSEMSWNPFFIFIYLHLPTISLDDEVHTLMNDTCLHDTCLHDIMEKWNCWLADIMFDWRHVMEMAFEHNNHTLLLCHRQILGLFWNMKPLLIYFQQSFCLLYLMLGYSLYLGL